MLQRKPNTTPNKSEPVRQIIAIKATPCPLSVLSQQRHVFCPVACIGMSILALQQAAKRTWSSLSLGFAPSQKRLPYRHPETVVHRCGRKAQSVFRRGQSIRSGGWLPDPHRCRRESTRRTEGDPSIRDPSETSPYHRTPAACRIYPSGRCRSDGGQSPSRPRTGSSGCPNRSATRFSNCPLSKHITITKP